MICKKYSEIDFELYEIVSGPFYECIDCEPCYTVASRTNLILNDYDKSCQQVYEIPDYDGIVYKTYSVDIPPNPYIPSYSTKTSPSESGKLCASNSSYNKVQISNKIKITIPYDPVFSGTYVFDRLSGNEWKLNGSESVTSINTCINTGDVNPTPKQLINFYEVNDPSNASECYVETYTKFIEDLLISSGNIYAFPAKYSMCLTQPAPSIDELGYRLSVGFTLPIRYRPRCQDWILVDRLYGSNGKKTPHTIYGSPNYAYYDDPYFYIYPPNLNPKFTFLNSDNSQACGSGINNLGFSFRCDGVSLGYNCQNICNYPYNGDNNETSWFTPKQPVIAQIEFVYDCRSPCACNTVLNYNEISASNWVNNNTKCYGSSVNINYDCTSQSSEPSYFGNEVEVYFVASEKYIFFIRNNIGSDIYYSTPTSIGSVDKVIKYPSTFSTPGIDIVYSMIYWINNNVSVFSTINNQQPNIENNKYSAVDIYWDTTNSTYKLYILPSED